MGLKNLTADIWINSVRKLTLFCLAAKLVKIAYFARNRVITCSRI